MQRSFQPAIAAVVLTAAMLQAFVPASAAIVEVGDLNIIDQDGNASDGLRFLDMTYGDGLTEAAALVAAQGTYANARLATPSEWNDLFAAADITYNGALTAADAFTVGGTTVISSGANYDGGTLVAKLGGTDGTHILAWSAPDGNNDIGTTRDLIAMYSGGGGGGNSARVNQSALSPPDATVGWLIVSEAAAVPEPASLAIWSLLGGIGIVAGRRRRRVTNRHLTSG